MLFRSIMHGKVRRAYLGIGGQLVNLAERMIAANKLEKKTGVYVFEVVADQPVNNNEIKVGDIIVEFNRQPIGTVDDLHKQLNEKSMGHKAQMGVLRNGRKVFIEVVPAEMK